jgi:hypothetical protein
MDQSNLIEYLTRFVQRLLIPLPITFQIIQNHDKPSYTFAFVTKHGVVRDFEIDSWAFNSFPHNEMANVIELRIMAIREELEPLIVSMERVREEARLALRTRLPEVRWSKLPSPSEINTGATTTSPTIEPIPFNHDYIDEMQAQMRTRVEWYMTQRFRQEYQNSFEEQISNRIREIAESIRPRQEIGNEAVEKIADELSKQEPFIREKKLTELMKQYLNREDTKLEPKQERKLRKIDV